jgi:hypothetical protein
MRWLLKLTTISALLCLTCLATVDSTAQTWSVPINITNNIGGSVQGPLIAIDPSGNPLVVWADRTLGNAEMFYSRYNGTS